jgi:hypothetical protein
MWVKLKELKLGNEKVHVLADSRVSTKVSKRGPRWEREKERAWVPQWEHLSGPRKERARELKLEHQSAVV